MNKYYVLRNIYEKINYKLLKNKNSTSIYNINIPRSACGSS